MLFSDFPEDIILEVMNHLVLPDHMSLLTTCSSIYRLSQQRSFWISVLDTTRKTSTIACPRFTPLSEYNLESLKEFVFSWLRLQKNWSKPYPLIRQPATFTVLSEPAEIILTVPGTDILLLHLKESGVIICWDVKMANLFSFLPVTTGGRIDGISAPSESYGIYVVAIQTIQAKAPFTGRRLLLTIKHENRKATSFESVFSDMLPETGSHFSSLFVTEHVVGSVVVRERQEHCTIVSSNLHSNNQNFVSSINLHREVINERDLIVCFTFRGHLFNLLEDGESVQIQHISRKSLSSGRCEESAVYKSDILAPNDSREPFCFILPSTPVYGVSAVFIRLGNGDTSASTLSFAFLVNTLTHASDDGVSSPLAFTSPCPIGYIPGRLRDMELLWMDHSGLNVVFVAEPEENDAALMLVRYHPETSSISTHKLALPDSIKLDALNSLCVDETAGAVHLVDTTGVFWTLLYV